MSALESRRSAPRRAANPKPKGHPVSEGKPASRAPAAAAPAGAPSSAKAVDAVALRAIALESAGDRHRAHLLWLEVAATASPERLRRYRVFRRLAKEMAARGWHAEAVDSLERHLTLSPRDADAIDRLLQARLATAPPAEQPGLYAAHARRFGESAGALILRATRIEAPRDPGAALATLERV
ncbi:hypothetical protein, partial [Methylobacterium goesingense]